MFKFFSKIFLCLMLVVANISFFFSLDDDSTKKNSGKNNGTKLYAKNNQIIDNNKSNNFNYKYKVDINSSNSSSKYIPIKFTVEIKPKGVDKFENILATGYIDDLVLNNMVDKVYNTFGNSDKEPLTIDINDSEANSLSISKESWLYEGTNIDRLIEKLKSGIQVKVNWNEEEEYVLIKDVEVNRI